MMIILAAAIINSNTVADHRVTSAPFAYDGSIDHDGHGVVVVGSIDHDRHGVVVVGAEHFENVISEKSRNLRTVVVDGSENFDEDLIKENGIRVRLVTQTFPTQ